jgi:hypothetical protein
MVLSDVVMSERSFMQEQRRWGGSSLQLADDKACLCGAAPEERAGRVQTLRVGRAHAQFLPELFPTDERLNRLAGTLD